MQDIFEAIRAVGGRPLIVGGAVRDQILRRTPKDRDCEVYGIHPDELIAVLRRFGKVETVGASFGVIKLWMGDQDFDFSLPRRESKSGQGHRGFIVEPDPTMTIVEAARRRDFTMNSLAMDPFTGELIDPFGGRVDIACGILRHTSPAFAEDPLRVLRAMQFAARFGMALAPETAELCRSLAPSYHELPVERVWGEWEKLLVKGDEVAMGLIALDQSGWLAHYPELQALKGCVQDARHHPEGDAWAHTLYVADAAVTIAELDGLGDEDRMVLVMAAICHDLGKPATTEIHEDGRITSYGHDQAGVAPTESLLERIGFPVRLRSRVVALVREHMVHVHGPQTPAKVRRLARRLAADGSTIAELARVVEADHSGRPPLAKGMPQAFVEILERAEMLGVEREEPAPILMGRHLLAMGFQPGPAMGQVLREAMEAQIEGVFDSLAGAIQWVRDREA